MESTAVDQVGRLKPGGRYILRNGTFNPGLLSFRFPCGYPHEVTGEYKTCRWRSRPQATLNNAERQP
ncbi:hypothetical protein EMIT0324P_100051 [Pseudomonas chlororaphis]